MAKAQGFGKTQSKGKKSSTLSLFDELKANRLEIEKEVIQERKERIKGISRDELMRSPQWVYEMANEETVRGTLNEMLTFLSDNNASVNVNLEALRQKALSDGGIDVKIDEEMYETIEFEGDHE